MVVMSMFPLYLKKEDVRDIVIWQRKTASFFLTAISLVVSIFQFSLSPKLLSLYSSLNINPPEIVQSSSSIMLMIVSLCFVAILYLLFSKPDYTKVDAVAKKYKNGAMIRTNKLEDGKFQWLMLGATAIMVIYLIFTTILPIYNLTSQY
jgi:hypothetical protein